MSINLIKLDVIKLTRSMVTLTQSIEAKINLHQISMTNALSTRERLSLGSWDHV